ncbi:MAG: HNH endonuclease [Synergistaceae bacterium]|nr:HNH endonuclease [Synergistaceae bacterium]
MTAEIAKIAKEISEVAKKSKFADSPLGKATEGKIFSSDISKYDAPMQNVEKNYIRCINENLEGKNHPETGVPYVRKEIEVLGIKKEVVAPEFHSEFDARLPEEKFQESDSSHFKECNKQLKEAVQKDPDLRAKFSGEQLEQIYNGDTPDGYTWHHDAESGKMKLVDSEIHNKTRHTGGRCFWGGGAENR